MAKHDNPNQPHISDLDDDISGRVGARVFYQLTDDEGGTDEPGGRKVPAVINRVYNDGQRDDEGRLLCRVFVMHESGFSRDAGFDSSRTPGTIDVFHPGDAAN